MLPYTLQEQADEVIQTLANRLSASLDSRVTAKLIDDGDIEALVAIDRARFMSDLRYSPEEFRQELAIPSSYGILVSVVSGRLFWVRESPAAYVLGYVDVPGENQTPEMVASLDQDGAYVSSFAVKPEFSGSRRDVPLCECTGVLLMDAFAKLTALQQLGYLRAHARLEDVAGNEREWEDYSNTGFRDTGVLRDHMDKGDHFYEYVRILDRAA